MQRHIFRTYDIRGEVGKDLAREELPSVIRALAAYYQDFHPGTKTVAVARDGRIHSPALYEDVCSTLQACGLDVLELGLCPTPVLHFALATLPIDAGIMVTASHNGPTWNGLKLIHADHPLWGEDIQRLYELYQAGRSVTPRQRGQRYDYTDMHERYVVWLADHFSALKDHDPATVFDCGNGAAGAVMPRLLERMGWTRSHLLYEEIDGSYPNHEADPVIAENMHDVAAYAKTIGASYGIGFDGDGDRMGVITAHNYLVPGDHLLLIYAQALLKAYPHSKIVYDAKCSSIVPTTLQRATGRPIASPSGHSIIRSRMRHEKALFGGELSCHFFFADRYFGYDDGIYAALRFIELLHTQKTTLAEELATLPVTYATTEWRISCSEEQKRDMVAATHHAFSTHPAVQAISQIDGIRAELHNGWCMVRASNTQPVIGIRCESNTPEGLYQVATVLRDILVEHLTSGELTTTFESWVAAALQKHELSREP